MNRFYLLWFLVVGSLPSMLFAQNLPEIAYKTKDMQRYEGYFDFYWDENKGEIWLEVDKLNQEFLYVNSLPAGVGSNDIGLDRGQLGNTRVVKFQRIGPKVLLIEPNYDYRAENGSPEEKVSVEQAFAQSVLWGFEVGAQTGDRVLVNATSFYMQDAHGVSPTLRQRNQGNYKLEASRSAIYLPRTKNFPQNTEVEAILTFVGSPEGRYVRQVVPSPEAITVRQHHSFVQLPDNGYQPRKLDPRAGYFGITYQDYANPLGEPLEERYLVRHRLQKKNPRAEISEAVEPIVYYIDPATPEPIRSAMLDGARWWNQAFEAAGYRDAFQVKLLPTDADPMDVRYNVVQWVHRATRGWSYGASVRDPRTGEIIKGHVTLGSLRLRQDYLIAEGLLAPYEAGKDAPEAMQEIALARLRQLVAHEIGHTLGLAHNYAASTVSRASVMDYPHPYIQVKAGQLDWSEAYDTDIGEWDKVAIRYGYSDFPEDTDEEIALNQIIQDALEAGLYFISDADARPLGSAHPKAHLWDNGQDATEELNRIMEVRKVALEQFSEKNIPEGQPYFTLEKALVPIYLLHRYQVEAAAKVLGGLDYSYALRGDGQTVTAFIPPQAQEKALAALLNTIKPENLILPERIIKLIPPPPLSYGRDREYFPVHTQSTFDPITAAEVAADMTIRTILQPERAARLIEQRSRNNALPGFDQVLATLIENTWRAQAENGLEGAIHRKVNDVVLFHMMHLASHTEVSSAIKSQVYWELNRLKEWLEEQNFSGHGWNEHFYFAEEEIDRFLDNPEPLPLPEPVDPPAGSPIGCGGFFEN